VATAKEIIEVAEKYKIYDLSHLARRYVITKAAVEREYNHYIRASSTNLAHLSQTQAFTSCLKNCLPVSKKSPIT
jgi:hypothetical protein